MELSRTIQRIKSRKDSLYSNDLMKAIGELLTYFDSSTITRVLVERMGTDLHAL
jgi:hypothetical protein